jgi:thiol-disulfide isomerase/thioredoxin
MNRRKMAFGATAALAAAAGVGVAWWQQGREGSASRTNRQPAASTVDAAPALRLTDLSPELLRDFWAMTFDSPEGQAFSMASLRGKPLLVNFWATWCPPCVEELPLLDGFYRTNQSKGWQVVGLAVDQPSAVKKWLQSKPLSFPVGLAGFQGTELVKSLGNASGSLPFTFVVNAAGAVLARKTGKVTPDELEQWVLQG